MADIPQKPTRQELSEVSGGNLRVIRALERIFDETVPDANNGLSTAQDAISRLDALVLEDLNDVTTAGVSDGYLLHYVNGTGQWTPTQYLQGIRFGAGSDYTTFESNGFMVGTGGALAWVDIDFPIIVRTTGVGIPTLQTVTGNITAPQWQVNDFNVCEGQELVHLYVEGSSLYWHIHMITNGVDGTDRYTAWEIEYAWANTGEVISAAATIPAVDILIPANTPDQTHMICPLAVLPLPTAKIGAHVYVRLKRVAAVGAAPTSDPWVTMLQAHIQVDTMGSRGIGTK